MNDKSNFPTVSALRQGAVLRTIAHAISLVSNPILSYEVSWDKTNYNRQNTMGTRGTISFNDSGIVGAFFDEHSKRNAFRLPEKYSLQSILQSMPTALAKLAQEETLQYLIEDFNGKPTPIITCIFWSVGDVLTAAESWENVLENGAHLIYIETLDAETAILELKGQYNFSPEESSLMKSIFTHWIDRSDNQIKLTNQERETLTKLGNSGLTEALELLEAVNILAN